MFAAAQLHEVRPRQACSPLAHAKRRSLARIALVGKAAGSEILTARLTCSINSQLEAKRIGITRAEKDGVLATDRKWVHPLPQQTFLTARTYGVALTYNEVPIRNATNIEQSVFQQTDSKPWTCGKAPKYITEMLAAKLAEWKATQLPGPKEVQYWLVNLGIHVLSPSTIKAYFTAYGIRRLCQMACLDNKRTKEENVINLKLALMNV